MATDVSSKSWVRLQEKNDIAKDRVVPYSFETEQALLGGLLLTPYKIDSISNILSADDFYDEKHRVIFRAIQSLISNNRSVDIISLSSELEQRQKIDDIGGQSYLLSLQAIVPQSVDIVGYAQSIADKSQARKLLEICSKIENSVYAPNGKTIAELLDMAESSIFKLTESASVSVSGPVSIQDVMNEVIADIRDNNKKTETSGVTGISTGYTELNTYTSGFHPGELIIVAARPAMGKTTFAMNLIENIAFLNNNKLPTLVFSLEMPSRQIATRLLASMGRIDHEKLKKYQLDEDDLSKMVAVIHKIVSRENPPIFIDDTASLSPMEIRARARRIVKEYGGISAIMVDYLQLMKVPGYDANSRHLEVGECSKSLKALAKELNVPVIALAQLNRGLEGRKDKRPMNADLRESGSIEQDADMILFVHREEVYDQNNPELKGKAEIIIGKQRNGPIGTINMFFEGNYSKFVGLDSLHTQV